MLTAVKAITANTVWRWAKCGVNGVRLKARRVGGRLLTSHDALAAFLSAMEDLDNE